LRGQVELKEELSMSLDVPSGLEFAYPAYPRDPVEAARLDYLLWRDPAFPAFVDRLTDIMYTPGEVAKRSGLRFGHRKPPFTGGGDFLGTEPKVLFAQTCSKDYGGVTPGTFDEHLAQTFGRYRGGQPPMDKSPGMEIGRSFLQGFLGFTSPPDQNWKARHRLGLDLIHVHAPKFSVNCVTPARAVVLRACLARYDALLASIDLRLAVLSGAIYARILDPKHGIGAGRFVEVIQIPYSAITGGDRPPGAALLGVLTLASRKVTAVILTAMPQSTWPPFRYDELFRLGTELRRRASAAAIDFAALGGAWPPQID
jgi:hypothetical protein